MKRSSLFFFLVLAGCGGRSGLAEGDAPDQFPMESPGGAAGAAGAAGSPGAGGGGASAGGAAGAAGAAASKLVSIDARTDHSCALHADGRVSCWGGVPALAGEAPPAPSTIAAEVDGVLGAAELSVGGAFACVRMPTGRVFCWGSNALGQLGAGPSVPCAAAPYPACAPKPVSVLGLSDAVQISSGTGHACAVRSSGKVVCWGANDTGQLGDGSFTSSPSPVEVVGLEGALEVASGDFSTCARTASAVRCWGRASEGQLGNGAPGVTPCLGDPKETCSPAPVPVSGLGATQKIRAGLNRACAVLPSGSVSCWGSNQGLALGNDSPTPSLVPAPLPSLDGVKHLFVGYVSSYAVDESGPRAWGADYTVDEQGTTHHGAPGPFAAVPDAVQLVGGWSHGCALTKAGQVRCWGSNASGQLGDGTTEGHTAPTPVKGL